MLDVVDTMNKSATQDLRAVTVLARDQHEARVDAGARAARDQQMRTSSTPGCRRARRASTGTSTARSTIPGRRSSTRLAEARRRRAGAGARPAHRSACDADWEGPCAERWRFRLHRRLVRLRGEGPADARAPWSSSPIVFCGGGDATACSKSLWAALDAAGNELAAAQGADPAAWRSDATKERIHFAPGYPHHDDALDEPADVPADPLVRRPSLPVELHFVRSIGARRTRYGVGTGEALPLHAGPDARSARGAGCVCGTDRPSPRPGLPR